MQIASKSSESASASSLSLKSISEYESEFESERISSHSDALIVNGASKPLPENFNPHP